MENGQGDGESKVGQLGEVLAGLTEGRDRTKGIL